MNHQRMPMGGPQVMAPLVGPMNMSMQNQSSQVQAKTGNSSAIAIFMMILLFAFLSFAIYYFSTSTNISVLNNASKDIEGAATKSVTNYSGKTIIVPDMYMPKDPNYNYIVSKNPATWSDNDRNTAIVIVGIHQNMAKVGTLNPQAYSNAKLYNILTASSPSNIAAAIKS